VLRLIGRWLVRIVAVLVAAFVLLYMGDWTVYKLRGSPQAKVTVSRYLMVPLKGNKQEYDYQGTLDVLCSRSLFPQGDLDTCWQLRRNPHQMTKM